MGCQLISFAIAFSLIIYLPLCVCGNAKSGLNPQFYDHSCPKVQETVKSIVAKAIAKETRMAASLIRLHFLDCFVKGCDASVLLDTSGSIINEKTWTPNRNTARGFEVIDEIKYGLEEVCPLTVSCADILAIVARETVVLTGGPSWEVQLGRKDSRDASVSSSNNEIPTPNDNFQSILAKFNLQGLNVVDLVTLSGTFINPNCNTSLYKFLDSLTPEKFDNNYYKDILQNSDQIFLTKNEASMELVKKFADNNEIFFEQFVKSMVKMGNLSPLTGDKGEIRKNCRKIN